MPGHEAESGEARNDESYEELVQIGQMAGLKALAGWLAHEINQPLMGILANAEAALHLLDSPAGVDRNELRAAVVDIKQNSLRIATLIRRLSAPLNVETLEQRALDVNVMTREVARLVGRHVEDRGITIELRLESGLPQVVGHQAQLQHALLHLLVNACDAVGGMEWHRRRIVLRTERHQANVLVSVIDSGIGGSHIDLARIFEPLYTTKPHRVGLGLTICQAIVRLHGGRLWAEPNVDAGMTFAFTLKTDDCGG